MAERLFPDGAVVEPLAPLFALMASLDRLTPEQQAAAAQQWVDEWYERVCADYEADETMIRRAAEIPTAHPRLRVVR